MTPTIHSILRKIAVALRYGSAVSVQESLNFLKQHPEEVMKVLQELSSRSRARVVEGGSSNRLYALSAAALLLASIGGGPTQSTADKASKALESLRQQPQQVIQNTQQVSDMDMSKVFEQLIEEYRDDPRLMGVLQESLYSKNDTSGHKL